MIEPDLARRAEAAGIALSYRDWRGETAEVSAETVAAILAALDQAPGAGRGTRAPGGGRAVGRPGPAAAGRPPGQAGGQLPSQDQRGPDPRGPDPRGADPRGADPRRPGRPGTDQPETDPRGAGQRGVEPPGTDQPGPGQPGAAAVVPAGRRWGFTVQLYSLRSRASWGHGDLRDLADLAAWSARALGAGFVLVNPLHAAEPLPPVSPSPYLPMTRRYVSPLYLRIEDIPEYRGLSAAGQARIESLAAPLRARNTSSELIDRDAVWTAKRAALEIIRQVPLTGRRRAAFERYRQREGSELADWAAWCALAQLHGPDWRGWPRSARTPGSAAAAQAAGRLGSQPEFHAWLQWLLDEQLAAAQRAALAAGMDIGIIHDLAVGVHPAGADAWAHQDLLVSGLSVGAPPDEFNQLGQDWAQPPWHPQRLAAAGYQPLSSLFGAALRHAGGLRADHVMGLMRLWCVPAGMPPDRGAYIRYDHRASVAALAGAAARVGGVAIGEDLGTVEPWFRQYLADSGILGTTLLWFARDGDGAPLPPGRWRRACMATVGSHDLPTVSGFLTGEQVTIRARLGLLNVPADAERERAERMLASWQRALEQQRLIEPGARPGIAGFTTALYGYLARTPALLIGVSLADATGDQRTQNVPGTSTEYPNWRIPLCDSEHQAVLLEDLPALPLVMAVARAAAGRPAPPGR
ncbi:MAG TPA: 4-alpha-glucanotransferase [Streptosporangiaceae bacterium]|jgi:4-alpha-glucanotransferase